MTEGSRLKSSKFFGADENEDVVEEDVGVVEQSEVRKDTSKQDVYCAP